jgi:monothiol glutaredoxin
MRISAMSNVRERIEKVISENPVVLFMKGTPEFPQCGFSGQVIQILDYLGAPVVGVNVLEDAELRQGIKEYANWPTIPQLYVKGEFVGGCDITREMFQSGELAAMLSDAGVRLKSQAGA